MRPLHGLGDHPHLGDDEVLPVERKPLLGPRSYHDCEGLFEAFPALDLRDPVALELDRAVAAPHADVQPLLAFENVEDSVRIDSFLLGGVGKEVFALRIKGQSMIDDGIQDGDFIFVKKTPSAHPGEIVVALIEDEATVKRYFPEGDRIRFQPANKDMEPIYVKKSDFKQTQILGQVVGVYRRLKT